MIQKNKNYPKLLIGIEIILGCIFLYSGLVKIIDLKSFVIVLRGYKLLPVFLLKPVAYILPFIELIFGAMFMLGRHNRIVTYVLSSLLIIFIAALSIDLVRGINTSCGCFSLISEQGTRKDMVFNILRDMLFLTLLIIYQIIQKRRKNNETN